MIREPDAGERSRIGAAAERADIDESLYRRLLKAFFSRTSEDLTRLSRALAAGDRRGGCDAAHSIKGAARTLSLEAISSIAEELEERLGRTQESTEQGTETLTAVARKLTEAVNSLRAELQAEGTKQ